MTDQTPLSPSEMVYYCKACRECGAVHCSDPVGCAMPRLPYAEAKAHHDALKAEATHD